MTGDFAPLKDYNPSAFPMDSEYKTQSGMTLRDYFAGQALMGMLAHSRNNSGYKPQMGSKAGHWHEAISIEAYALADAMLTARKDKGGA